VGLPGLAAAVALPVPAEALRGLATGEREGVELACEAAAAGEALGLAPLDSVAVGVAPPAPGEKLCVKLSGGEALSTPAPPLLAGKALRVGLRVPLWLTEGEAPTLRLGVGVVELVGEAEGEVLGVALGVPGAVGETLGVTLGLAPLLSVGVGLPLVVEEALGVEEGVGRGVGVGVALGEAVGVPLCVAGGEALAE
jgi:hypothetical protein